MLGKFVLLAQLVILSLADGYFRYCKHQTARRTWVVGVEDIASNVTFIGTALDATTVCLYPGKYYNARYHHLLPAVGPRRRLITRVIWGPVLLARLASTHKGFVYVGSLGFLLSSVDRRNAEFRYLSRRGKTVVCVFTGTDIRSLKLMADISLRLRRDVISTYLDSVYPAACSPEAELGRRELANVADRYASLVFNAPVDQAAQFETPTEFFPYLVPDAYFHFDASRFRDIERVRVLHAPSQPVIKGTPLVHAAVHRLQREGYDFEYVEITGRPNAEVLAELQQTHIVLNEFYSFVPGLFGIEALASGCVLLTSADPAIEPGLTEQAASAWVITPYWLVYDNLKALLDNPSDLGAVAAAGQSWAWNHYSMTHAGSALRCRLLALVTD